MGKNLYSKITFTGLLLILPLLAWAQPNYLRRGAVSKTPERGLVLQAGGGIAAIKSDICGSWGCNNFGPNVSIGALYKMSPYLSLGGNVDYLRLGAEEKDPRKRMNVSFQSEVIEVTGTLMINLLDSYSGFGYRSSRKRFLVPYVRLGGGFVYYSPTSYPGQGKLNDSQVKYDPERQYPAVALVIPFGGGLRFRVNDEICIAPELMYHITSTDYLDNIGPRTGNPATKDHYGVASVKIMYTPPVKGSLFSRRSNGK